MGERPFPSALVGDDAYVDEFADSVDGSRFPGPDADLIPRLTKARFVAAAARDADETAFAERIDRHREPVFEPLVRFDAVATLVDETRRDRLDDDEIDDLVSKAGLDDEAVTPNDDPETVVDAALTDRDRTFFDYPAPPLHVVESARSRGRELLEETPDERAGAVEDDHRTYVRQRASVEAIVAGARDLAMDAYDDVIEDIRAESPSNRTYESEETYAEVVAFNAALAAESMLEANGEIVTPP